MRKHIFTISLLVVGCAIYFDRLHPKLVHQDIGYVDKIVVEKQQRILSLFSGGKHVKTYPISLGREPMGHKTQEGDGKTPEGNYFIDWVRPSSSYYKAIRVSYPNATDKQNAMDRGVAPGGDIMIHGMPNGFGWLYPLLSKRDWTEGCIGVSNTAMDEIESSVKIGGRHLKVRAFTIWG